MAKWVPSQNGSGAILAMVSTIAKVAIMIIEESEWIIIFKRILYAALMPS